LTINVSVFSGLKRDLDDGKQHRGKVMFYKNEYKRIYEEGWRCGKVN
jgi:hypothetical protein